MVYGCNEYIIYFTHDWQNTKIIADNEVSSFFVIFCNGKYKTLNSETTSFQKVINSHNKNYTLLIVYYVIDLCKLSWVMSYPSFGR